MSLLCPECGDVILHEEADEDEYASEPCDECHAERRAQRPTKTDPAVGPQRVRDRVMDHICETCENWTGSDRQTRWVCTLIGSPATDKARGKHVLYTAWDFGCTEWSANISPTSRPAPLVDEG